METVKPEDETFLPDTKVLLRYNITEMSLWRWDHNPNLGFPKPHVFSGRKYRKLSELIAFEARAVGALPRLTGAVAARSRRGAATNQEQPA